MSVAFRPLAGASLALAFLSCSAPSHVDVHTSESTQVDGGCPATLKSGAAAGATCKEAHDCAETCCSCGTGSNDGGSAKKYGAQACFDGKCAPAGIACSEALEKKTSLCQ